MYNVGNSTLRLTGMASGLDTQSIVSELMKVEKMSIDTVEKQKKLAELRSDQYREVTNKLRTFKDEYFDILNKDSYLLSAESLNKYTFDNPGSSYFSLSSSAQSAAGEHTVKVVQLATSDEAVSATGISSTVTGDSAATLVGITGQSFSLTVDGNTQEIDLTDPADGLVGTLVTDIQTSIDTAFGSGKILVSETGGTLSFAPVVDSGVSKITMESSTGADSLGFSETMTNRITSSETLENISDELATAITFNASDEITFEINGESFTFDNTDSLTDIIKNVNRNTDANVVMSYDEVSDIVTISSKETGEGDNLTLADTDGNFLTALGLNTADPVTTEGQDAIVEIDGNTVRRSNNSFTVNDVRYSLHKAQDVADDAITYNMVLDTDEIVNTIAGFVEKYNEILDYVNEKVSEEYDRDYLPLTDEEKEGMSEDDIKLWEEKSKAGLLHSDSILESIASDLRYAMSDSVEGITSTLAKIGISSQNYLDKGKLYIDDVVLKQSLQENPDDVLALFTQQSETHPSYSRDYDYDEFAIRKQEEGIFSRIYDVIENNITTRRDTGGNKGILIEKAGISDDASLFDNDLYESIQNYEDKIDSLWDAYYNTEDRYYNKYASLETAMQRMNSQMEWLTSQLNGMG